MFTDKHDLKYSEFETLDFIERMFLYWPLIETTFLISSLDLLNENIIFGIRLKGVE